MFAIVGGSSLLQSHFFSHLKEQIVKTEYGDVRLFVGNAIVFCQRHGADPKKMYTPPHLINKKAIVMALSKLNVTRVISIASVGSLNPQIQPGMIVIPDDFFNPWDIISFYEDARSHFVPTLDTALRKEVVNLFGKHQYTNLVSCGTYAHTKGPRFETKAEVKFLSTVADIVGMTVAHEAILFAEQNVEYAVICIVDNMGNGLDVQEDLSFQSFRDGVVTNEPMVEQVLELLMMHFMNGREMIEPSENGEKPQKKRKSENL